MTFDSYVLICLNQYRFLLIVVYTVYQRICEFTNSFCFGRINFTDSFQSMLVFYISSVFRFSLKLRMYITNIYLPFQEYKGTQRHSKIHSYESSYILCIYIIILCYTIFIIESLNLLVEEKASD